MIAQRDSNWYGSMNTIDILGQKKRKRDVVLFVVERSKQGGKPEKTSSREQGEVTTVLVVRRLGGNRPNGASIYARNNNNY